MKLNPSSFLTITATSLVAFLATADDTTVISPCTETLVEFRFPLDDTLLKFCSVEQQDEDTPPVLLSVEGTTDTSVLFDPYLSSYDPLLLCAELENLAEVEKVYGDCAYLPQDLIDLFQASREPNNDNGSSDLPPSEDATTGGNTGSGLAIIKQSFTNGMSASTFQNEYCRPHNVHRHPIISCACLTNQKTKRSFKLTTNHVYFTVAVLGAAVDVKLSYFNTTDNTWITEMETKVGAGKAYQFPNFWGTVKERRIEMDFDLSYPGNPEYHFVGYIEHEGITCPPSGCNKKCRY